MKKLIIGLCFLALKASSININVQVPATGKDIYFNLLDAVMLADDGDVVTIPAGNFVFSNQLVIDRKITIAGQGIKNTFLYRSESVSDASVFAWKSMFLLKDTCTISGITFKSKRPSEISGDGFSTVLDYAIIAEYVTGIVIKECRFENFGNAAIEVRHRDNLANGLITNNEFYHNYKGEDGQGLGYAVVVYGEGKVWVPDPKFGTKNFIFIENNSFDYQRHGIASAGCGLYVFRYNTVTHNIIAGPFTHVGDTHEGRGPGNGVNSLGSRASEIYNNKIIGCSINGGCLKSNQASATIIEKAIAIKSGDAVVYNNEISGFRFGVTVTNAYTSQPETVNLYYWNNTFTPYISSPSKSSVAFYNYNPTYFLSPRDYQAIPKPNYTAYKYPY